MKLMGVKTASELAEVIVSVGLAQNLGALRALATEGIQRGHMALHARQVAVAAGAPEEWINPIAEQMIKRRQYPRGTRDGDHGRMDERGKADGMKRKRITAVETKPPGGDRRVWGVYPAVPPAGSGDRAGVGASAKSVPIKEKAVPGLDEDTVTIGIEAARNALARAGIDPQQLRAVWTGSESHPYAVKPSSTIIAEAIGASSHIQAADLEFACKAGTEAMVMGIGLVGSGMGDYALALGVDTAQGKPGDALEYTAAAGGAAFVIGPAEECRGRNHLNLFLCDRHAGFLAARIPALPGTWAALHREPAYFKHVITGAKTMMEESGTTAHGLCLCGFSSAECQIPKAGGKTAWVLRMNRSKPGCCPGDRKYLRGRFTGRADGDTGYAKPGDRILMVSYGSGAGSDALDLRVTDRSANAEHAAPTTADYIARRIEIDYATYARYRGKLQMRLGADDGQSLYRRHRADSGW